MTKLIEESTVSKTVKNAIDTDKLLDWLVENSVLSIALEGKKIYHFLPAKGLCATLGRTIKLVTTYKEDRNDQAFWPEVHSIQCAHLNVSLFQETLTRLSTVRESKESLSYWGVNCRWTNSPRSGGYRSAPATRHDHL